MPGFTLIYQFDGLNESIKKRTDRLVEASFKIQYISKTDEMLLLFRDGNQYPYEIIETKEHIAVIEGRIYGINISEDKYFQSQIEKLIQNKGPVKGNDDIDNAGYFRNLDGEFIIYIIDKKGEKIVVFNDYLGRLPVYVYHQKQFILSRDMFVLDKITPGLMFDDASIYQYLRIGYPVGNRTLYHDIDRLKPSSLVTIENEQVNITNQPIDIEELANTFDHSSNPEEALYEAFTKAVKNRFKIDERIILSLSGGLDSRVIMGVIEKNNLQADYSAFNYDNAIINSDVAIVKQLSRHYGKSPNIMEVNEWSPEFFDEFTLAKGGMNYLGMAFILHFLKNLASSYQLMITGDGGDKTLPGLLPGISLSQKQLSNFIVRKNEVSSRKTLRDLFLFDAAEEEKKLKEYLASLPGSSTNMKYKHFQLFERGINWLFEGEDRNRSFIWSTTPFYSPAFFKLSHSIPEKAKSNFKLFRAFTNLVDNKLNDFPNANWGIPLANTRQIDKIFFRQKIKNRFRLPSLNMVSQSENHEAMIEMVIALMHKGFGGQLSIYADQHDLRAASGETLYHLLSLLKVSEMTWKSV